MKKVLNELKEMYNVLKVLVACGNGMGSSLIIKMKIEKVLQEIGLEYKVYHTSIEQAKIEVINYDFIIVSQELMGEFENVVNCKVIGLYNLLSEEEIKEKLLA